MNTRQNTSAPRASSEALLPPCVALHCLASWWLGQAKQKIISYRIDKNGRSNEVMGIGKFANLTLLFFDSFAWLISFATRRIDEERLMLAVYRRRRTRRFSTANHMCSCCDKLWPRTAFLTLPESVNDSPWQENLSIHKQREESRESSIRSSSIPFPSAIPFSKHLGNEQKEERSEFSLRCQAKVMHRTRTMAKILLRVGGKEQNGG